MLFRSNCYIYDDDVVVVVDVQGIWVLGIAGSLDLQYLIRNKSASTMIYIFQFHFSLPINLCDCVQIPFLCVFDVFTSVSVFSFSAICIHKSFIFLLSQFCSNLFNLFFFFFFLSIE